MESENNMNDQAQATEGAESEGAKQASEGNQDPKGFRLPSE